MTEESLSMILREFFEKKGKKLSEEMKTKERVPLKILETVSRPGPNDIKISSLSRTLQLNEVLAHRANSCPHYNECLVFAIKHHYISFSCSLCFFFLKT